jgi:hypothetical protein
LLLLPPVSIQVNADALRHAEILRKHEASFGGRAALAQAGDLYLEGTFEEGRGPVTFRAWIRRDPFAIREEYEHAGDPSRVFISDGAYAWELRPDGKSQPMPNTGAIALLDWAFFTSFAYLDRVEAWSQQPVRLPDVAGGPEGIVNRIECVGAFVTTPADSTWMLGFDPRDGRLHGMCEEGLEDYRWKRFGAWKPFGPVVLPTVRVSGSRKHDEVAILTLLEIRTGQRHPSELFAGSPSAGLPPLKLLSRLQLVRTAVPGSAAFLLPLVRINDKVLCTGQIDTGASALSVQPQVSSLALLPPLSITTATGGAGDARVTRTWVDSLDLGGHRLVQLPAHIARHPLFPEIPLSKQPAVTLGGLRFMECAPVLDLAGSTLSLRARPVLPLRELPGPDGRKAATPAAVIELPFTPLGSGETLGTVAVTIPGSDQRLTMLLDTGFAPCLRISARGIARAKLPGDRETWIARGAIPVIMHGIEGVGGEELLVRLDAFTLGPITFERPWVMIGLGHMEGTGSPDGLVGAGALIACARVGFDLAARKLELEPGAAMKRSEDGSWIVPPSGEFLGLLLLAPDAEVAAQEAIKPSAASDIAASVHASLPRVREVFSGTRADRAGVRVADLLLSIDGRACEGASMDAICASLWAAPGKTVRLVVRRGNEEREIAVVP